MSLRHKTRLYVEAPLSEGVSVALLDAQSHYLKNVLRLKTGDAVAVFNGQDGEFLAKITVLEKKSAVLECAEQLRAQQSVSDIWCLFAPIKRNPCEFLVEKATELGVAVLQPVITDHCEVRKINAERLRAHAIEAAEQCERLDVPELRDLVSLEDILKTWPPDRRLIVCAERADALPLAEYLQNQKLAQAAFLIGPEGGFSKAELAVLADQDFVDMVTLGPQILRAETAVCAALAVWQSCRS